MGYCTKCGNELLNGAKFCAHCGAPVDNINIENESKRKIVFDGEVHRCPHCGWELKSFETICPNPDCALEIRGVKHVSAVIEFSNKIEELDRKKTENSFLRNAKVKGSKLLAIEEEKISLISNFLIPNTKEDILEFMLLSSAHILNIKPNIDLSEREQILQKELKKAWLIKFEQAYEKAKICINNQKDREIVESCYNKTIILPKKKRKTIALIIVSSILALVLIICGIVWASNSNADPNLIRAGVSSANAKGQYYEDVADIFEEKGFIYIERRADDWSLFHKSGTVKSVTIDGRSEFSASTKFSKDAKIIIVYYG